MKNRPRHGSRVSRERAGSASCISHYIHMTPVFLLAGKRFPLVSLPFRTLCEVLFEWPPQCPTISHDTPVCKSLSLFLSTDRPIDRSSVLFLYRSLSQIFQSTILSTSLFHSFFFYFFILSRRSSL